MFEDFQPRRELHRDEKMRFKASVVAATVICVASSAAAISASNEDHLRSREVEELMQIEFKPPAPPAPPPPPQLEMPAPAAPAPPTPAPKPKVKPIKAPTKLSDKKLAESDAPLPDLPLGRGDGVPGGTGSAPVVVATPPPPPPPPPPPRPAPVVKPAPLVLPAPANTPHPKYSAQARRKGIQGVVNVVFDVLENGSVANVRILSGPAELHENVRKALAEWRFKPAQRGGKPVIHRMQQSFRFNLSDR